MSSKSIKNKEKNLDKNLGGEVEERGEGKKRRNSDRQEEELNRTGTLEKQKEQTEIEQKGKEKSKEIQEDEGNKEKTAKTRNTKEREIAEQPSTSGFAGFESKYKGGFAEKVKNFTFGKAKSIDKERSISQSTIRKEAQLDLSQREAQLNLSQGEAITSTPTTQRKIVDWLKDGTSWGPMSSNVSSPILGRSCRSINQTVDSTRIEADPMDGVGVNVSLKVDSGQPWQRTASFGDPPHDASFCSALQQSSQVGTDSEMEHSMSSAKKKKRANSKGSKESTSESESPIPGKKGKKKKRILRDESESKSPNKSQESIKSGRENEKEKTLEFDVNTDFADEQIKHKFAAATTTALGDRVLMWLREVDELRGKCKNMQGKVSGHMKSRIKCAGIAVENLLNRFERPSEDLTWIRMRNSELQLELRESQRETDRLRNELEISRREKVKLERELGQRLRKVEDEKDRMREREDDLNRIISRQIIEEQPIKRPRMEPMQYMEEQMIENTNDTRGIQKTAEPTQSENKIRDEAGKIVGELTNQINDLITLRKKVREQRDLAIKDATEKTKTKPRIVENIQIVPPREEMAVQKKDEQEWQIVNRKVKKKKEIPKKEVKRNIKNDVSRPNRRRVPKTAAVTIKSSTEGLSYADMLKNARESVSLREIGIEDSKIRKARNGAIVIELPGENASSLADRLAEKLRTLYGESATVARPSIKGELRLIGLDDSVTKMEITTVIAALGDCNLDQVYTSEIKSMRNGMGIAWSRCPLDVAIKVAAKEKIRIGWTNVKVELLKARPLQCYRCWESGHVKENCQSAVDRSAKCFRCGSDGHRANGCDSTYPKCAICSAKGLNDKHRMGGYNCCLRESPRKAGERRAINENAE